MHAHSPFIPLKGKSNPQILRGVPFRGLRGKRRQLKKSFVFLHAFISKPFLLLDCCLIFFVFSHTLLAQRDSIPFTLPKKMPSYDVIKCNPAAILMGPTVITSELGLNYEFSLSKKHSVSLGASLLTKNVFIYLSEKLDSSNVNNGNNVQAYTKTKITGYRLQAQYKWILPFVEYPCGLYIGPHASFSTVFFSYQQRRFTKDFYRIVHQNISLLLGYQHIFNNKLFVDLYCGLGYKNNYAYYYKTLKDFKKVDDDFILTGIPINVKFSLGYYIGFKL